MADQVRKKTTTLTTKKCKSESQTWREFLMQGILVLSVCNCCNRYCQFSMWRCFCRLSQKADTCDIQQSLLRVSDLAYPCSQASTLRKPQCCSLSRRTPPLRGTKRPAAGSSVYPCRPLRRKPLQPEVWVCLWWGLQQWNTSGLRILGQQGKSCFSWMRSFRITEISSCYLKVKGMFQRKFHLKVNVSVHKLRTRSKHLSTVLISTCSFQLMFYILCYSTYLKTHRLTVSLAGSFLPRFKAESEE